MKIETPATIVQCLPRARAPDTLANLKVLANAKRKFSKIVIHVGANDVRLHESEITKYNVKEVCELASTMSDTVICSGPLLAYRGDEIHSRLSSLNGWMSKWCTQNNKALVCSLLTGVMRFIADCRHSMAGCLSGARRIT